MRSGRVVDTGGRLYDTLCCNVHPLRATGGGGGRQPGGVRELLVGVLLHLVVEEFELNTRLAEELLAFGAGMVFALTDHALDATVDDEHGAGATGGHAAVEGGAIEGDATASGLADGVLLGMDGAHAVGGDAAIGLKGATEEVSHLVAMGQARGGADVSGYEQLTVFDYDTATATTVAGGPLGGGVGKLHEIFVPAGTAIHYLAQHLLYLLVEQLDGAVVVETEVGPLNAPTEVLLVGVGVVHLTLFVGEEGFVADVVGLRATKHSPLVADLGVGIDGKEIEVGLAPQGIDLASGADALDDAVAARGLCLLVQLFYNPRGGVLGSEVVADQGHAVAIYLHAPPLDFFDKESPDREVYKAPILDKIIDDGALAST